MRTSATIAAIVILAGVGTAQSPFGTYTSPPPLCFALNDAGTVSSTSFVGVGGASSLDVHFKLPGAVPVTADRVDIPAPGGYSGPAGGGTISYEIFATASLGGPLVGLPVATLTPSASTGSWWGTMPPFPTNPWAVWLGLTASTPFSLTGGMSYAFAIRTSGLLSCVWIGFDAAGTQPLGYQIVAGPPCTPSIPPSGQLPFALRFRSTSCGPGPPASVSPIAYSCGGASSWDVVLFSTVPPVLGSQWFVRCFGPAGETIHLFWSVGVVPGGNPIASSSCLLYLEPTSLLALAAVGLEPIASATLSSAGYLDFVTFNFTLPSSPSLAGTVLGAQALIIGPSGMIPIGGAFAHVSNALMLTLGY